jgi:hypothetical protein
VKSRRRVNSDVRCYLRRRRSLLITRAIILALIFSLAVRLLSARPNASSNRSDWDTIIREAVIRELGSPDSGDTKAIIYVSRRCDLNNDGRAEMLIWVPTFAYGGTSGYPLLIYRIEGRRLRLLSRLDQVWTPLIISRKSRYGWRDVVMQMGGGGDPLRYAVFRHNRETYSDQPRYIKAVSARGWRLIAKDWQLSTFGPLPLKK